MGTFQQIEILLIEDNPGDVVLIQKMLSSTEFKLRVADRLSQALEEMSKPGIDIVLLDLSLPDSEGLDTFSRVHATAQGRPIIVLSGLEDETRAVQAVHAGAQDYLTKGEVNSSSLTRSVRYALERGRLEKERAQLLMREQAARSEAEAAQQRFLDLMDSIEGIVWESDAQTFAFVFVSRQAERVLGYPIERWLEEPNFWRDHIHPDDREWAVNYCIRSTTERRNHEFEYRMIASDGREVWLRDMVTVIVEKGEVTKLRGVMFDVTERKQAEEERVRLTNQIEQERERLISIISNVPGVVWENRGKPTDPTHSFDFISDYAETMLGYTVQEWLTTPNFWLSIVHPEDREQAAHQFYANFISGNGGRNQFRWIGKDGRVLYCETASSVIKDADGQPIGMRGITFDRTELKQAEQALAARAKQQASVARLGQHALLIEDVQVLMKEAVQVVADTLEVPYCKLLELSPDGNALLYRAGVGWREEMFSQAPLDADLHPAAAYTLRVAEPVIATDLHSETRFSAFPLIHEHGIVSGLSCIIPDQPDRPYGVLSVYTDFQRTFTQDDVNFLQSVANLLSNALQRQRTAAALRELNATLERRVDERTAELEWSNRELNQFAYVASHDLKAPLRSIDMLATWVSDDVGDRLPPKAQEYLQKMRGRIQRMERLLTDLLAYSRINRQFNAAELVDTGALVRDVVHLLAPPEGFTIMGAESLPVVVTERVPLETIFRNLIDNAIRHHHDPSEGQIHISAQIQGQQLECTIADNGPGIDTRYHDRIFQVFQTLKPRDQLEASGMGLAIVKKFIESRGGSIEVESGVGDGTTFHFTWPIAPP